VTGFLFECGANILEAQQFNDLDGGTFFMRVAYDASAVKAVVLCADFGRVADEYGMLWAWRERGDPRKILIIFSKFDRCLANLLYRQCIGDLPVEIAGIVCNPPERPWAAPTSRYLPRTKESKPD
jgi:formyltetrahydrofolate deformylase